MTLAFAPKNRSAFQRLARRKRFALQALAQVKAEITRALVMHNHFPRHGINQPARIFVPHLAGKFSFRCRLHSCTLA